MWQLDTIDEKKMTEFGYQWGGLFHAGDIICLDGDLGAGKTTLTQSIAKGMNIKDYVNSPTYTIICEYQTQVDNEQKEDTIKNDMEKNIVESDNFAQKKSLDNRPPLYHMDVYRIMDEDELYEIGFEDYLYGDGVCIIECASKIENMLPKDVVRVYISVSTDGLTRNIKVNMPEVYKDRWRNLFESFGFRYQHADGDGRVI